MLVGGSMRGSCYSIENNEWDCMPSVRWVGDDRWGAEDSSDSGVTTSFNNQFILKTWGSGRGPAFPQERRTVQYVGEALCGWGLCGQGQSTPAEYFAWVNR